MKTQSLLMLLLLLFLAACKKETKSESLNDTASLYRLKVVDVDEAASYSAIQVLRSGANSGLDECENEEDGKESEYCYCKKKPDDKKCKPLPIKLEYFKVQKSSCCLIFEWKTSYEENVKYFIIEVSKDKGLTYQTYVKDIKPKGPGVYKLVF